MSYKKLLSNPAQHRQIENTQTNTRTHRNVSWYFFITGVIRFLVDAAVCLEELHGRKWTLNDPSLALKYSLVKENYICSVIGSVHVYRSTYLKWIYVAQNHAVRHIYG